MDDKRFDSLTRAFASGTNRRKFLLGLIGLGGAAALGTELDSSAEAARRPTPTPTPPKCPGQQTYDPVTKQCICVAPPAPGTQKCGPSCCNPIGGNQPAHTECCDQACCAGTCMPEELCCATNRRAGGADPSHRICETVNGDECCLYTDDCCIIDGCCATVCHGGSTGDDFCCPAEDFCPGGSESPDECCTGNTYCCGGGTNGNICLDRDDEDACCFDSDCDSPPDGYSQCAVGTCVEHVCRYTDCAAGSICCPDNQGVYACRAGGDECCLTSETCADTCEACVNFICVDDPNTFPCGPTSDPDQFCCPSTNFSLCCQGAKGECCGVDAARDVTRECAADGSCCPLETPYFCAGSGTCCSAPCVVFGGETEYCCPPGRGRVCDGAESFVCCPNSQECSDDGECCAAGTVSCGDACCATGSICCADVTGDDGDCCPDIDRCNDDGECCPEGSIVCSGDCCYGELPQCCNDTCVAEDVECCSDANPCDGECEICVDGACKSACDSATERCCPDLGTNGLCVSSTQGEGCCVSSECTSTGPDKCLVGACRADGVCRYTQDNSLCGDCGVCSLSGSCSAGTCDDLCDVCSEVGDTNIFNCTPVVCPPAPNCFTGPGVCDSTDGKCDYTPLVCPPAPFCFTGTGVCDPTDGLCDYTPLVCPPAPNCFTGTGVCDPTDGLCDYTPLVCPPAPNCFTGAGVCDPTDGQCDYTPVVCNTPGVCQVGPGTCNAQSGVCEYLPQFCDPNQCLTCVNSQCVSTCPVGTHCNGAGGCDPDVGGLCADPGCSLPVTTSFNRPLSDDCLDDNGDHYACLCASGRCNNGNQCCNSGGASCSDIPFCPPA